MTLLRTKKINEQQGVGQGTAWMSKAKEWQGVGHKDTNFYMKWGTMNGGSENRKVKSVLSQHTNTTIYTSSDGAGLQIQGMYVTSTLSSSYWSRLPNHKQWPPSWNVASYWWLHSGVVPGVDGTVMGVVCLGTWEVEWNRQACEIAELMLIWFWSWSARQSALTWWHLKSSSWLQRERIVPLRSWIFDWRRISCWV